MKVRVGTLGGREKEEEEEEREGKQEEEGEKERVEAICNIIYINI